MSTLIYTDELDKRISKENAKLFYNMTIDEFYKKIKKFANEPSYGFNNLKLADGFFNYVTNY